MTRVLVVGQTPPPHGGQAIMIESLLAGRLPGVELFHVRMAFSRTMNEMGKPSGHKLLHAAHLIGSIVYGRFRHRASTLYYPPSGPSRGALLRDYALLVPTRWLFAKTVLHFHAGGTSEAYARLSLPEKLLFKLAFCGADCTIRTSPLSPDDGAALRSKLDVIVPNGVEDPFPASAPRPAVGGRPVILFAGLLCRSKGVDVLVEAARLLAASGVDFELRAIGAWQSAAYRASVRARIERLGLGDRITFPGVLTGADKARAFGEASVFCFPSYFEAETFGVAVLEAMAYAIPVVTTRWRGLPALVEDGATGFVVEVRDSVAVADKLRVLLADPERARAMGEAGRAVFVASYTREHYLARMREVFLQVAGEGAR